MFSNRSRFVRLSNMRGTSETSMPFASHWRTSGTSPLSGTEENARITCSAPVSCAISHQLVRGRPEHRSRPLRDPLRGRRVAVDVPDDEQPQLGLFAQARSISAPTSPAPTISVGLATMPAARARVRIAPEEDAAADQVDRCEQPPAGHHRRGLCRWLERVAAAAIRRSLRATWRSGSGPPSRSLRLSRPRCRDPATRTGRGRPAGAARRRARRCSRSRPGAPRRAARIAATSRSGVGDQAREEPAAPRTAGAAAPVSAGARGAAPSRPWPPWGMGVSRRAASNFPALNTTGAPIEALLSAVLSAVVYAASA